MVAGMLVMVFACWFYSIAAVLLRVRAIMLERERSTAWVAEHLEAGRA
jgi:heme exporter protein C